MELKEKEEELRGYVLGAAHKAEVFQSRLDRMEERVCRCGQTPSEVGEELSSEEDARTELSYALARVSEYIAPPVENLIPIPVPAPCLPRGSARTCPALEEIVVEPRDTICNDLDALLREVDVERVRDLQEKSFNSVVHPPPQIGSDRWRELNGIHCMHPGPGRRDQRTTRSRPYVRRPSSKHRSELWGPGEPGRRSPSPPSFSLGAINSTLFWGAQELPPSTSCQANITSLFCFSSLVTWTTIVYCCNSQWTSGVEDKTLYSSQ